MNGEGAGKNLRGQASRLLDQHTMQIRKVVSREFTGRRLAYSPWGGDFRCGPKPSSLQENENQILPWPSWTSATGSAPALLPVLVFQFCNKLSLLLVGIEVKAQVGRRTGLQWGERKVCWCVCFFWFKYIQRPRQTVDFFKKQVFELKNYLP